MLLQVARPSRGDDKIAVRGKKKKDSREMKHIRMMLKPKLEYQGMDFLVFGTEL